ncbi:S-layer homology domain-containing protein [Dethiosulfatibacter aminovorans DSM 17477]|uniref:S-layer homology domain-containing protein n=1 Tax=Dethiosulfatibacter aminovorans DSM 17477 TaxID=1121476 RepID=A0A1M6KP94_9FIRM|nr:S-layer homology domain-containing protein [Dethiosulfatibacter aminovorans]SHJ60828.1 S-layer homology domain-containing protein [Dethiosulfatibacter aminovorans DSM 17477]
MKKILLFTLILTFLFVGSAYGQEFPDVEGTKYEEAVEFLSAYGVVNGFPDGTFKPDDPVTRAQISKMITIVLGFEEFTENMESTFTDMDGHWAERYVEVAHAFDIVQGYLDGTFGPDNEITYTEVITMIVRSLGYTDQSLPGAWPYDYLVKAGDLGIVDGIPLAGDQATRGDIALMTYNALFSEKGTVNTSNNQWETSGELLLSNIGYGEEQKISESDIEKAVLYPKLKEYEYYRGNLFYNSDDEIVYFQNVGTKEDEGKVTSVSSNTIIIEDEYGNRKPYDTKDAEIILNGVEGRRISLINSQVRIIYYESDENKIEAIIGRKLTKILLADSSFYGQTVFNGIYLPLDGGIVNDNSIYVHGDVDSIYDIRPNDVIYAYETDESGYRKTYLELEVVRNRIEGAMTETTQNSSNGLSKIDGVQYSHSDSYIPIDGFGPGYYVAAYLDKNGEVVKYNIIRDLQQPEDYGLVIETTDSNQLELPKIRLIDNSGAEKTYHVNLENDLIVESGGFNDLTYSINLSEGDVIKFNLENADKIKKMDKVQLVAYDGIYDNSERMLTDIEAGINDSTLIYTKDEDDWIKISLESLDEFIKGDVSTNEDGDYVELLIVENGIITNYPDTVYSVPDDITKILNLDGEEVYRIYGYVEGKEAYIYSGPSYMESLTGLEDYMGQLLEFELIQDKIKSFSVPNPELTFSELTNKYGGKILKAEGTFYEYADDVKVYIAEENEEGYNITGIADVDGMEIGDQIQLYDVHGDFDGIMDIIILIKK